MSLVVVEFQFTHPGGVRRRDTHLIRSQGTFQFTHPGGVRRMYVLSKSSSRRFNSRTREGCDQAVAFFLVVSTSFQFTHPGGVRLSSTALTSPHHRGFNSRTREGCDACHVLCLDEFRDVSIHAPGRGATRHVSFGYSSGEFQFTHPGGVRRRRW